MEEKKFTRQEQKVLRTQGKKGCPKCLDIKPLEEFSTSGPKDSKDVDKLIMYSDLALYSVKNDSKSGYKFFGVKI